MINKILQGIFNVIIALVNWILSPLELALNAIIPNFSNALGVVTDFVNTISGYVSFGVSYTGLTVTTMTIIKTLLISSVMIPITVHAFKLAIKWYNAFKL